MNTIDRKNKVDAIFMLLKYSLLIPQSQKTKIINDLPSFPDDVIDNLGAVLAYEHRNRDQLDEIFVKDFLKKLMELDSSYKP